MKQVHLISTILLLSFTTLTKAQTYFGLQQSNYGGIHQSNLNPANITKTRHKFYFNTATAGFGFNNDYLSLSAPFSLFDLISGNVPSQYKNSNGSVKFNDYWLKESVNGRSKNFNLYYQTKAPGFMLQLPAGLAIGLQYISTVNFQINNVAEPLARLARYGIDSSNGTMSYSGPNQFQVGQTFGDNAFSIQANAYGTLGLTIAKTIIDNEKTMFKIGITPKLVMGYATAFIKNRGLQVKADGTDSIVFGQTDLEYGYSDPNQFTNLNRINTNFFSNAVQGKSFAYDFGASYELKDGGNSTAGYKLRAGISLLDGGKINYGSNMVHSRIQNTDNKTMHFTPAFAQAWSASSEQGLKYTDSVLRTMFTIDSSKISVSNTLPTSLNLQFDYHIFKMFYVGMNWSQDVRGRQTMGMRRASYLMVLPRIESRGFEFSLPIGLMNDYRQTRLGLYFRMGPVFFGSDNLLSQLKNNNINGTDLYFGVSFGLLHKNK